MRLRICDCLFLSLLVGNCLGTAAQADDAYENYVKTSKDFKAVRQDPLWLRSAFPAWTYMPWTYQWQVGYTDESGKWSVANGYNGAFVDRGDIASSASPTGRLEWIDKHQLPFYVDHLAGKGDLHIWDGNLRRENLDALHSDGIRAKPVNDSLRKRLQKIIESSIRPVKSSPFRSAYALDDEASWGHFVHPTMWKVTDDPTAYESWLQEIYGSEVPKRDDWITYETLRLQLAKWRLRDFDASPLMDQWTFNDSYWNNFIGDLVEYSNSIDPDVPTGWVGGQSPNAFGGYDYAKVMRKLQFIESYNIGGSQAIIRSFNPSNAIPSVTTHFHRDVQDTIWQTWYYLAHGNRGFIGWVEKWFDGDVPKPWHAAVAPHYLEAGKKIGPLMQGATWKHDGIAIYYNHASVQLGWIMDAEAHGKTWVNRNNDERLGSSHQVRKAWCNMLRDSGLQFNFISYVDAIQNGIPPEYKVLILPMSLCLSDVEAQRIREFANAGGTVIADFMPGLWDQHGKGRSQGGILDDLFGVAHSSDLQKKDVFGGTLWCELDQDRNFDWKTYQSFLTNGSKCLIDKSGFHVAVREMRTQNVHPFGRGQGILMNLSPQWYNAHREQGASDAEKRRVFIAPVERAVGKRWVEVVSDTKVLHGYEVTYWNKGDRILIHVVMNPELSVTSTGGGNAVALQSDTASVRVQFQSEIADLRDERNDMSLGKGRSFEFQWPLHESLVLSIPTP